MYIAKPELNEKNCSVLKDEAVLAMSCIRTAAGGSHELMRSLPIPEDQWPESIKQLNPRRVSIDQKGMWITKSGFFVEEEGIFVPRG